MISEVSPYCYDDAEFLQEANIFSSVTAFKSAFSVCLFLLNSLFGFIID